MQVNKLLKGLLSVSIAAAVAGAHAQSANPNNPYTEGTDAAKIQNKPTSKDKNKATGSKRKAGHEGEAQVSGPSGTVTRDTTGAMGTSGTAGSTTSGSTATTSGVSGTSSDVGGSAGTVSGATTGTSGTSTTGNTGTGSTTTPPTRQ